MSFSNKTLVFLGNLELPWSGGLEYQSLLRQAFREMSKIEVVEHKFSSKLSLLLRSSLSARKLVHFEELIADSIHFPWPHSYSRHQEIQWIPDLQHITMPEFFSKQEFYARNKQIRDAIVRGCQFYFSSRTQETIFQNTFGENSLGVVRFSVLKDSPARVLDFGLKFEKGYIYFPSQFWIHKNHLIFLRAFEAYRKEGGKLDLVLTGGSKDYRWPNYERIITELIVEIPGVHYLGLVSDGMKNFLFQNSHIVFQPSLSEGWSIIIEEAIAHGKFIFASNLPNNIEQLDGIVNKFLFDPFNIESMVDALTQAERVQTHSMDTFLVSEKRRTRFLDDLAQLIEKIN